MSIYKNGVWKHSGSPNANLLPYSDFSNIVNNDYILVDNTKTFNNLPVVKITASGYTSNSYKGWNSVNLKSILPAGEQVTVSIWVYREDNPGIDNGCEWRMYQAYSGGTDWSGFYNWNNWPANKWVKFSKVYTVRNDATGIYFNMNVVRNGTYWISQPKIELGNVATGYVFNQQDKNYLDGDHGFIEPSNVTKIQKNDYIEANSFIEI